MAYRRLNGYRPLPCPKEISADGHETLWRIVQYAVAKSMDKSPEYFTPLGHRRALQEITTRICAEMAEVANDLPRRDKVTTL